MKNTRSFTAAFALSFVFSLFCIQNVSAKTFSYTGWNTGNADDTAALISELQNEGWTFSGTAISTTGSDKSAPGIKTNAAYIQTPVFSGAITNIVWNGRATSSGAIVITPVSGSAETFSPGNGKSSCILDYDPADAVKQVRMTRSGGGQVYFYSFTINTLDPPYPTPTPSAVATVLPQVCVSWPSVGASNYSLAVSNANEQIVCVSGGSSVFAESAGVFSYVFNIPKADAEYDIYVKALAGGTGDDARGDSECGHYTLSIAAAPSLQAPSLSVDTDALTTSSATVSWPSVEHASGYAVEVLLNDLTVFSESLDATAVSWTVSNLQPGTEYEFSVTALGDGIDYADSAAATVEFTTVEDLSAPDWTIDPDSPEFEAGKAGSFTVSAVLGTDDLTSDVSLSVSPSPVSAPVLSEGSVSWTPAWEDAGKTYSFTFSVNVGGTDYEHLVLIPLEALPTVSLSILPASIGINIGESAETALSAVASDSRDPLALTAVSCDEDDLTDFLDAETGAFSWTPSAVGEYAVSFSAADAYPLSDPAVFAVTVTNGAPALAVTSTNGVAVSTVIESAVASASKTFEIVVTANDVFEAPELSVTPAFADGFTVSTDGTKTTGTLTWTFEKADEVVDLVFTATDSRDPSLTASQTVTVTVVAPPLESVWPSVDEIASNSFLLEWDGQDQPRLDHFKLRVWYGSCDMGSETTDKEYFREWYDNYTKKNDSHFPQDWTYSGTGRYSKPNTPLKLESNGMYVITKKYPRPLTGFSFTLANNAARSTSTNSFEIYASKGGVENDDWTLIPNDQCGPAGVKTFAFNAADGYRRVKVALKLPSCNIGIGSFSATYEGAGTHFIVGTKDEAEILDKETVSRYISGVGSDREYFVQLVTCGTSGEEMKNYYGSANYEFYTRVHTLPQNPATVMLFK